MSKRMNEPASFRYLEGVSTLRFFKERCISCGRCIEVCPHAVFGWQNNEVMLQDRDACMECGACARNCPASALEVRAGVGCAYAVLASSWFRRSAGFKKKSLSSCSCTSATPLSPAGQPVSGENSVSIKSTGESPCCGGGGCCGS